MPKPKRKLKFARQHSAGGVVYRKKDGKIEVIIYKPATFNYWQLPKGWIDKGETAEQAALREVKEEGGVEGKIIDKIDTVKYFFVFEGTGIFKMVDFYLMEYVAGDPANHDWEAEKAEWVEIDAAIDRLTFNNEKEIVKKAKSLIASS